MRSAKIVVVIDGPRWEIHNGTKIRGGKTETLAAGRVLDGETIVTWSDLREDLVCLLVEAALEGSI